MDAGTWHEGEPTPLAPASLRGGILWNAAGQITARAIGLASMMVLARLLLPRDFGLLGIGIALVAFATQIADVGVGAALVQRQREVRENASAAFYMNATAVFLLSAVLLFFSETIARYFRQPALDRLLPLLTAGFLIRSAMFVHETYMRKRMLFRKLQLINIASAVAYAAVAIPLAVSGAGVWSLAWGLLAGSAVYAGSVLVGSGMPLSINPHFRYWHGLSVFGRWYFLGGLALMVVSNGDNLAVGKFLGPSDLGAYALAYSYGLLPLILIGGAIGGAAFPVYSRLQEDRTELQRLVVKLTRVSAVASLPIAGMMLFTASDFLVALLGPKWTQAGPPFCLFAVVFTALMFASSFPRLFDAIDRPVINLYLALAALPVMVVAVTVGLRFGIMGVALGISAMQVFLVGLGTFALSKTIGIPVRTSIGSVWPPALCVGGGIVAGMLPFVLMRGLLPHLAVDAIASLVAFGVYVFSLRRFFPPVWSEALDQARNAFATRSRG